MNSALLQHRTAWQSLLLILSVTIIFIAFIRLPGDSLLWLELQDTGHTLLFILLTLATLRMLQGSTRDIQGVMRIRVRYLVAALVCLATGIASECVQLLSDRNFSLLDIARDLGGIIVAMGLFAVFDPQIKPAWNRHHSMLRIGTFTATCVLLAFLLYPLASLALAFREQRMAFPVIMDLQSGWSGPFLQFNHAALSRQPNSRACQSVSGNPQAKLIYKVAHYPGISILDPYPDWRGYEALAFTLHTRSPTPFTLYLRIHDQWRIPDYADSYTGKLEISRGINHVRIPLEEIRQGPPTRELDLSGIRKIMLFARKVPRQIDFCASIIRLE